MTRLAILLALGAVAACSQANQTAETAPPASTAKPASAPDQPPPPLENPLEVGTQDAKDDLYCSGVIFATYPTPLDALAPVDQAILERNQILGVMLAESGVNKLVAQKAAHATQSAAIATAYADKAEADMKAGTARLSLETCEARAKALPPPQ